MRLACSARVMGALAICCGLLGSAAEGETQPVMRSLDPPVMLPDGTEFKTWEQPRGSTGPTTLTGRTRTPRTRIPAPATSVRDDQPGGPDPAAWGAGGGRLRHLPRVGAPGARRLGTGPDDQL